MQINGSENENDELEAKVYEIGFHIVPNISPENVKSEFEAVKKVVSNNEGSSFITEGLPVLKTLTYTISKEVKAVKSKYDEAYFAWIKFTALPNQIEEIKKELDQMDSIIRYLIISTVRENTMVAKAEAAKESPVLEDIDKTIDELVIQ